MVPERLTEDIITDLSRNGWLFVIARNSSFSYKDHSFSTRQVAHELGVRYLVEGTVRHLGERLRISAQLVDADSGTQEWSQRYDCPLSDLFEVQEEIVQGIVASLGSQLRRAEGRRARRTDPDALDAWGLVHRGMAISWSTFNQRSNEEAERLYRRAVHLAPDDARAHAFLAACLAMKVTNGWSEEPRRDFDEAWERARKALDVAPDDPIVLGQVGHAHSALREPEKALRLLRRSIDLDPNGAFSIGVMSYALTATGQAEEAIAAVDDVMRRSPRDPAAHWYLAMAAWAYLQLEQYDDCVQRCRESLDHYDGWQPPWITLAVALAMGGHVDDARVAIRDSRRLAVDLPLAGYQDFLHYIARDRSQSEKWGTALARVWSS